MNVDKLIPVVHLNGTSGDELARQWLDFARGLEDAMKATPECNGRDYYLKGERAGIEAREELAKLRGVLAGAVLAAGKVYEAIEDINEQRRNR